MRGFAALCRTQVTEEKAFSQLHRGRSDAGQCPFPVLPFAGSGLGTMEPGYPPCLPLLPAPMAAATLLDLVQVRVAIPRSSTDPIPKPRMKAPAQIAKPRPLRPGHWSASERGPSLASEICGRLACVETNVCKCLIVLLNWEHLGNPDLCCSCKK